MDWGGYHPVDPGDPARLQSLPRAAGKRAYDLLMGSREARVAALERLLARDRTRDRRDAATIGAVEALLAAAEPDPRDPTRLAPVWRSVASDAALLLGDLIVRRSGGRLRWAFHDTADRRDPARNQPVLVGLPGGARVDVHARVTAFALAAVAGRPERGDLGHLVTDTVGRALGG